MMQVFSEIEVNVKWTCECGEVNRVDISTSPGFSDFIRICKCGVSYTVKTFDPYENYVEVLKPGEP